MDKLKKLWKNDYFQTALMIVLVIIIVFGFWSGMQYALGTEYPMLAVSSGSMCMLPGPYCDGWSHPFARTLHVGDLIIVRKVDPADINAKPYPYGDIIVFHRGNDLIVHRAIDETVINGKIYFTTKGDGNDYPDAQKVSQDDVVGRVIFRIPWLGHVALLMRSSFATFIIIAIIILLVLELIIPVIVGEEGKKAENAQKENAERASQT
ncbi:MAG: signal peptidase I [Candidatus Bathyarchaeia archaeon]